MTLSRRRSVIGDVHKWFNRSVSKSHDASLPLRRLFDTFELSIFFLTFDHLPLKMVTSFMNALHSRDMAALTIIGDVMYFIADQNSGGKSRNWLFAKLKERKLSWPLIFSLRKNYTLISQSNRHRHDLDSCIMYVTLCRRSWIKTKLIIMKLFSWCLSHLPT